jgi:capsular polysaccharide biosynthesis protein
MARRIHTPLLTRVVLVLVACCMARFAWTTITNKYHVEVKIIVRQKPDPNNNTHWKNVQYRT